MADNFNNAIYRCSCCGELVSSFEDMAALVTVKNAAYVQRDDYNVCVKCADMISNICKGNNYSVIK